MPTLLLILISLRPFIASLAFRELDTYYSYTFIILTLIFLLRNKGKIFPRTALSLSIYLLLSNILLFIPLGANPLNSLGNFYKYLYYLCLYLAAFNLDESRQKGLTRILLISFVLAVLYSLYFYFIGSKCFINDLKRHQVVYDFSREFINRGRSFVPFILPSILAAYIGMLLPIFYYFTQGRPRRPLTCCFILLACMSLYLTKSVGGIGSFFLSWLLVSALTGKTSKHLQGIIFTALISLIGVLLLREAGLGKHTSAHFSLLKRLDYWKDAALSIKQHPFLGTGIDNFWTRFSIYVHNSYLQLWVETGLSGFLIFLTIIFISFRNIISYQASAGARKAFLFSACVFLFGNLSDFSFYLPEVSYVWWLILGLTDHGTPLRQRRSVILAQGD